MVNTGRNKKEANEKKNDIMNELARFSSSRGAGKRNEFMQNLISEYKFVADDKKMRKLVETMLKEEFSSEIKNVKSYDFLVESVITKLKNKATGGVSDIDLK